MHIRAATVEDAGTIAAGMRDLFRFHYKITNDEKYNVGSTITDDYIRKTMAKLDYYVIGHSFIRGKGNVILDLWVPDSDRGKGVGTALVRAIMERKTDVVAQVDSRNELAMQFWSSFPEISLIEEGRKAQP